MSQLTLQLMGKTARAKSLAWPPRMLLVTDRLVAEYGTPSLGNFKNPVKEVFYILLSARTTERLYQRAHRNLFRRFPRLDLLALARARDVSRCIRGAGLGQKRAAQVVRAARRLVADFGRTTARHLRRMSPQAAFAYLTGLPGLGPKSALCIMMYSLDLDVFPVDVNVRRVLERLGALPPGLKHYRAQQLAPALVPAGRSKELHIGLLEHGRRVCLPVGPRCADCILADLCRTGRRVNGRHRKGVVTSHGA